MELTITKLPDALLSQLRTAYTQVYNVLKVDRTVKVPLTLIMHLNGVQSAIIPIDVTLKRIHIVASSGTPTIDIFKRGKATILKAPVLVTDLVRRLSEFGNDQLFENDVLDIHVISGSATYLLVTLYMELV